VRVPPPDGFYSSAPTRPLPLLPPPTDEHPSAAVDGDGDGDGENRGVPIFLARRIIKRKKGYELGAFDFRRMGVLMCSASVPCIDLAELAVWLPGLWMGACSSETLRPDLPKMF